MYREVQRVVFDMEVVKSEEMACYESTFATVVAWKKRRYEMMYAKAWDFNYLDEGIDFFEEENNLPGFLGNRIFIDQTSIPELLDKYAGIRIREHELDDPQLILSMVREELNKGMPAFTLFDQYYSPWASEEERTLLRQRGALLIIGIDETNSELYCLDVHGTKRREKLPIADFLKGCTFERKQLVTFEDLGCENLSFDWSEIFITALENNLNKKISAFNQMRALANDIEQCLDFDLETKDCLHQSNVIMLNRFKFVCRARLQFNKTLKLLNERFAKEFIPTLIEKFSAAQINWSRVASPLARAFLMKNYSNQVRLKMAAEIRKAADFEEQIAEYMKKLCEGKHESGLITNPNNADLTVNQVVAVDLKEYLNNKGFGGSASEQDKGDFNGLGDYFLKDGLPPDNSITIDSTNYRFLTINEFGYDNIACAAQIIRIPNSNYEYLTLMGCCEWERHSQWGSFLGNMEIIYENGPNQFLDIEFSDWGILPICGEKIAWAGFAHFNNRKYPKRIFSQKYKLDKGKVIEKIKLPDCQKMHIFAVALIK